MNAFPDLLFGGSTHGIIQCMRVCVFVQAEKTIMCVRVGVHGFDMLVLAQIHHSAVAQMEKHKENKIEKIRKVINRCTVI